MSDQEKYLELLKEIGEALASKNSAITYKTFEINRLRERIDALEEELAEAKK